MKKIIAIIALIALEIALYLSASGFFNLLFVRQAAQALNADHVFTLHLISVLIVFSAALIAAFFSVFIYSLLYAGQTAWIALGFSLPIIVLHLVFAYQGRLMHWEMAGLYTAQLGVTYAAFWLMSYAGKRAGQRLASR